jgi:hypothetical protein
MRRALAPLLLAGLVGALAGRAAADDKADATFTWFNERRVDAQSLNVYHPQVDLGVDLSEQVGLSAGYEADMVSGATESIYAAKHPGVDMVSNATQFHDTRHAGHGGLAFTGRRSRLSLGYSYGTERDYKSQTVSVTGAIDLPGKNSTFQVSYSHNFDKVCDFDNGDATPYERRPLTGANPCFSSNPMDMTTTHDVAIDTTEATLTQNLSPTMVLQLGVHGEIVNGFQSNPYRRVRVGGFDAQEQVPLVRDRLALFGRLNIAFPGVHSSLGMLVRGYDDTWGVKSATLEMLYSQYLGQSLIFRFRARAYQQTKAVFFQDAADYENFGASGTYFTGDRELSPYRQWLLGAKLSLLRTRDGDHGVWGVFDDLDFHVRAEAIWAQYLTDNVPGGEVAGITPDMLVLSLGLLLRY